MGKKSRNKRTPASPATPAPGDDAPVLRMHEGDPVAYRDATVHAVRMDDDDDGNEQRLVELSFSSETPVLRVPWFDDSYFEVLGHDDDEVHLERLNNGGNVFYNHRVFDPNSRIGGVIDSWLDDGFGRAEVRISNRPDADGFWIDIRDGLLTTVSVGYAIHHTTLEEARDDGPDVYRVDSWTPLELSFVGVPADPNVGAGRSADDSAGTPEGYLAAVPLPTIRQLTKDPSMKKPKTSSSAPAGQRTEPAEPAAPAEPADQRTEPAAPATPAAPAADLDAAHNDGVRAEVQRRTDIETRFANFLDTDGVPELLREALNDPSVTADAAGERLLDQLGGQATSAGSANGQVQPGDDVRDKYYEGARNALLHRAGMRIDDKPIDMRNNTFGSFSLRELARQALRNENQSDDYSDPRRLIGRAFTSTSDFPRLLTNIGETSLLMGYNEAPEIYPLFTGVGTLSDFRAAAIANLSSYSNLEKVPQGGEFKYGTVQEEGESVKLATYGSIFPITRQAIINDDLNAFTTIPQKQGRAARRLIGDLVFDVLFDNANMSDGVALFDAAHKNVAVTDGAPDADTISEANGIIAEQLDAQGNVINVIPKYILVQPTERLRVAQIMNSDNDPGAPVLGVTNPVQGFAEVLHDARMSQTAARKGQWFLLPDPAMFDSISVYYLNGNDQPFLDEDEGFRIDGIEQKVRIDVAVKATSHRALFRNLGA